MRTREARSVEALEEREHAKRFRAGPRGVRWSVDLTEEEAAIITEAAGDADPSAFMVETIVSGIRMGWLHQETSANNRTSEHKIDCDMDDDCTCEAGRFRSELEVVVVRQVDGGRYHAARGFGSRTVEIAGSWETKPEAVAAAVDSIDEARRQYGLAPLGNFITVRFPEAGQKSWEAPQLMVRRASLPKPSFAQTARDRRRARRAAKAAS